MTIEPVATFRTASAGSARAVCLSASMDAFDPTEPYTRLVTLRPDLDPEWSFNEHDFVVPSICAWREPDTGMRYFVALGEDGVVVFLKPDLEFEQIAEAGLHNPGAKGYGYLNDIQQIGDRLHACGFSGQVYRREADGVWSHMDRGILQEPGPASGQFFAEAIGGASESSIYVVGSENLAGHPPRVEHWNGIEWRRVELPPTAGRITNLWIETADRVWLCGASGTLLLGNAQSGFRTMNPLGERRLFLSVTVYRGAVYLGSNRDLVRFDPGAAGSVFRPVRTGLIPELQDANVVQAVDDVLWSMGPKDIARFDGTEWRRFDPPDNPPIGTVTAPTP